MLSPRGSRRRAGASLQLGHVVHVFEEHLYKDMVMPCKSKKIMALLRPYDLRRWFFSGGLRGCVVAPVASRGVGTVAGGQFGTSQTHKGAPAGNAKDEATAEKGGHEAPAAGISAGKGTTDETGGSAVLPAATFRGKRATDEAGEEALAAEFLKVKRATDEVGGKEAPLAGDSDIAGTTDVAEPQGARG